MHYLIASWIILLLYEIGKEAPQKKPTPTTKSFGLATHNSCVGVSVGLVVRVCLCEYAEFYFLENPWPPPCHTSAVTAVKDTSHMAHL